MEHAIYNDIAKRTNGDIYLGVVGPVRTGKSTFIKKFMEEVVLDLIDDVSKKARTIDELPQSADGKTIMTAEPKFVPNEAIKLNLDNTHAHIRLIDCVGYLIDGVLGHKEGKKPRLVNTPWSDAPIPFEKAAAIGTEKVIKEHSTVGVVVTTDGSITDIERANYIPAEEKVIGELKEIGKPFIVVMNTKTPEHPDTKKLCSTLSEKYCCCVHPLNVEKAKHADFSKLLLAMLDEFPLDRIDINLPDWFAALPKDSTIFSEIVNKVTTELPDIKKMCDYTKLNALFAGSTVLEASPSITADAGTGVITLGYAAKNGVFYKVLSEAAGETIDSEKDLLSYMFESGKACRDYAKIKSALESARETGYGIVSPLMDELTLEEPELVKKGAGFGVRLRASAPSLHIVSVDVTAEVCPAIGSEQQGEDLINYLMKEFEEDKAGIWNTAMFGKSLSDLVREDMNSKSVCVPADVRKKLKKTIGRIVNESKGGVLCILL